MEVLILKNLNEKQKEMFIKKLYEIIGRKNNVKITLTKKFSKID